MQYPRYEMESRNTDLRSVNTEKRSFQRKLRYLKENMDSCFFAYTKVYTLVNGKKKRAQTEFNIPILHSLDAYYWLYMTHAETFYGLGKYKEWYIIFSFKYDTLEEPSVKIILSDTREALIRDGMNARMYRRYMKDTSDVVV
jgi:hypothetical protein